MSGCESGYVSSLMHVYMRVRMYICIIVLLCINMLCIAFVSKSLVVCVLRKHGYRLSHVASPSSCVSAEVAS